MFGPDHVGALKQKLLELTSYCITRQCTVLSILTPLLSAFDTPNCGISMITYIMQHFTLNFTEPRKSQLELIVKVLILLRIWMCQSF